MVSGDATWVLMASLAGAILGGAWGARVAGISIWKGPVLGVSAYLVADAITRTYAPRLCHAISFPLWGVIALVIFFGLSGKLMNVPARSAAVIFLCCAAGFCVFGGLSDFADRGLLILRPPNELAKDLRQTLALPWRTGYGPRQPSGIAAEYGIEGRRDGGDADRAGDRRE